MIRKPIFLFLLFVFSAVLVSLLMAFVTDQSSSLVIGQPTFMNGWFNQANPAAGVMDTPEASYYDGTRFYVADSTNNRVLIYNSIPVTTGAPANVVVGQPDFLSFCQNQGNSSPGANTLRNPSGVYSDGTRLYIADQDNNRVLIYNSIPVTNDTPADVVVGQVDFVSWDSNQGGTPEANTVYVPQGVSGTGSYLFISDWGNDRVLIYNSIPVTNNAPANVVVGQVNFTGGSANQGGLTSANSLSSPVAVGSNGTNLCIADRDNNRVLIYNSIPVTNNAPATLVIGQNTMTGNAQNYGGLSASSLSSPYGVYAIGATILIADYSNSRVLIYNSLPVTNGAPANVEVGQSSMNSSVPNQGGQPAANTLRSPMYVSAKGTTLFIADTYNNRALIFDSMPVTNNANASVAVGQTSFAGGQINGGGVVSANSLHNPAGLATDGTNLYSADPANNRVLIYDGIPTTSNPAASVVVGQSSMSGSSANQGGTVSANTLNNPWGVASDGTKLYISDQNNNRVLIYNSIPVTNNANASLVLGQISMGVNNSNEGGSTANNTLYGPEGICVSGAYLFVVDTDNNRVLIYNPIPTSSNSPAYVILGQPNTSTNISNDGGETASTMSFPSGVCYDGTRLFIADYENNRVLIYNSIPVTTGAPANVVVGQAGFTTSTNGSGPAALSGPQAVYSNGTTLFIADSGNNRILVFNTIPTTNGASADEALGQPTTSGNSANQSQCLPSANSLYQPSGLSGSASQLYVADSNNSRILSFSVNTPTLTITNTPTITQTPTITTTFTQTPTPTFTQTQTPTFTQTQTPTFTQTQTPTFTQTQTPTFTQTQTPTFTQTQTPTFTQTHTPTFSQTQTPTFTQTATPTFSQTQTPTFTQTQTPTFTQTQTPTFTQTATPTFTQTQTPTFTQTSTPTFTQTHTPTFTQTQTPTYTQTATPTFTQTQTPIFTQTQTFTFTQTGTPTFSQTATPTFTQTHTPTFTPTQTATFTQTQTPTFTRTQTPTFSPTQTPTVTETQTSTLTSTSTPTATSTMTPTLTHTSTPTLTSTNTPSATSTWTSSVTASNTSTATSTKTSTSTPTSSFTTTWTPTPSLSPTISFTQTPTITSTWSLTPTISFTPTITLTPSPTGSVTNTPTPNVPMYLSDNYFNPATGATLGIDVLVPQGGEVKIVVFNMLAEEVDKLVDQTLNPGSYHFTWDGRNRYGDLVGNGVYLVVIEQPSGNFIRKVIVLK